ncbi:MAG: D-alanyl-D-alanine carboxypeptidase [uncultured Rubrobacteraceae bacterium]|uniref:D-alanyl-D-alanine carboxypeptidase n=1 Tax=uncultured Rubrobacteraceae bacterium TaxID=349277 RepID=A0A6J4RHS2_9ACTN|nr:MAG: D-alanyl-D-alanine carboxypeptidase [uncultured Rubrobacteraceae bacterium]
MSIGAGFCTLVDALYARHEKMFMLRNPWILLLAVVSLLALPGTNEAISQETTTEGSQERPAETTAPAPPGVTARAWTLVDLETGEYLAGEGADGRLPMASTTKVMTGLVAFEMADEGRVDLEEPVVVSEEAASYAVPAYSNVGLFAGDTLSVRELLAATLISSGDDAAYALAEHLGGGGGEAGVSRFVEMMNEKAAELGLRDTRFENPIGFDAEGHHTTARELARTTLAAYEHPGFAEMVGLQASAVTTADREIPLQNTNELLYGYAPAIGVKTGTTPAAGPSLVSAARSGDESYVAVVLDDEARFEDSANILEYGFAAHDRKEVVLEGERYAEAPVPYRRDEEINLVAEGPVDGLVATGEAVETRVEVVGEMPPEARAGTPLGRVEAYVGGEKVGEAGLVAATGYEEASIFRKVWYTAGGIFE